MMRHAAALAVVLCLGQSWLYAQSTQLVVKTPSASVHKSPSTGSPVIGHAERGAALDVTREVGDWVKVYWPDAEDGVGYVHLSLGSLTTGSTPAPTRTPGAGPSRPSPSARPVVADSRLDQGETRSELAASPTVYVATPTHVVGLGGRMGGSTLGFGASARGWTRKRLGVQFDVSRYVLSPTGAPERATSVQFAPSVLYSLPDKVTDYVWMRPYVGGGANFHRQTLTVGAPDAGASVSETKLGYQGFGGAELTFASMPRFALSGDLGYRWSDAPFAGYDLGGVVFSVSAHWYIR